MGIMAYLTPKNHVGYQILACLACIHRTLKIQQSGIIGRRKTVTLASWLIIHTILEHATKDSQLIQAFIHAIWLLHGLC